MTEHRKIQQNFLRLQQNAGITTPRMNIHTRQRMRTGGPRGTQSQFNAIRTNLNQLLSQPTLNVTQIQKKIADLQSLNPGRWPMPQDYQALLAARTRGPAVPTRMPTAPEQSDLIQKDFKQLRDRLGLSTSTEQMTKIYPSPALPGSQQQLNAVRIELNRMLSKPALDDYDIVKIKQKIDELASLNPPRWPQAQDYTEILELRK